MSRKKKIIILLLTIITISLGYLRDYIFVSINEETGQGLTGSGSEHQQLFILKWLLTFLFAGLYFLICILFLKLLFHSKKYTALAFLIYALLIIISFLIVIIGYFSSSIQNAYPFVRTIMGIAQSPVILMILIPACYWNEFFAVNKK